MRCGPCRFACGPGAILRGSVFEPPNFDEAKEVGQHRFCAAVLVRPIRMKSIPATAHIGVDQRCLQIVFAKEPGEGAPSPGWPLNAVIGLCCRKAGGNRRQRLDRLLVECSWRLAKLAEALVADRSEVA